MTVMKRTPEQMRADATRRLDLALPCDLGDDGGPCEKCLEDRQLAEDVLGLQNALAAAEKENERLRTIESAAQAYRSDYLTGRRPGESLPKALHRHVQLATAFDAALAAGERERA